MKSLLFLLVLLSFSARAGAQQKVLSATHPLGKRILFSTGDRINVAYAGYLGQPEQVQNKIVAITDSTLVLGRFPVSNPDQNLRFTEMQRTIRISDIQGFRPQHRNRALFVFLYQVGSGVAAASLSYYLLREKEMAYLPALGIGLAVNIGFQLGQRALFPSRIRYRQSAGWALQAVNSPGH